MKDISCVADTRDELLKNIIQFQQFYNNPENLERSAAERYGTGRKKHNRRCAKDMKRELPCPYRDCSKYYGSEGSLNLHIKLKHNGGNKTDREKIAKSLVYAVINGIDISDQEELNLEVNLPPGIIEKAAEALGVDLSADECKKLERFISKSNEVNRIKMKREELKRAQKYSHLKVPRSGSHSSLDDDEEMASNSVSDSND